MTRFVSIYNIIEFLNISSLFVIFPNHNMKNPSKFSRSVCQLSYLVHSFLLKTCRTFCSSRWERSSAISSTSAIEDSCFQWFEGYYETFLHQTSVGIWLNRLLLCIKHAYNVNVFRIIGFCGRSKYFFVVCLDYLGICSMSMVIWRPIQLMYIYQRVDKVSCFVLKLYVLTGTWNINRGSKPLYLRRVTNRILWNVRIEGRRLESWRSRDSKEPRGTWSKGSPPPSLHQPATKYVDVMKKWIGEHLKNLKSSRTDTA